MKSFSPSVVCRLTCRYLSSILSVFLSFFFLSCLCFACCSSGSEGTGGVHSLLNHGGGAGGGGSVSTLAAGVGSGSFASAVFIGGALLGDEVDMQWKIQGKKLLFVKGNRTQQQSAHQQCTLQAIQVIGNLVGKWPTLMFTYHSSKEDQKTRRNKLCCWLFV